jgi:hypothetical protein
MAHFKAKGEMRLFDTPFGIASCYIKAKKECLKSRYFRHCKERSNPETPVIYLITSSFRLATMTVSGFLRQPQDYAKQEICF